MMLSADSFFFEGATERAVLETLKVIPRQQRDKDEGGKSQINDRIKNTLGPKLGGEIVRCLILRDLDSSKFSLIERLSEFAEPTISHSSS